MARKKELKVYIVKTPVENYCGVGAGGIQFAHGQAEVCEGWLLDWFREHGYEAVEKDVPQPIAAEEPITE